MRQDPNQTNTRLSDEQLAQLARQGDAAARIGLIGRYMATVKARVADYAGGELEPEDLAQEGMIGLMQAIDRYDPARGASFRTFALLCIDRSVISVVRASLAAKKIPPATRVPLAEEETDRPEAGPEEIVVARESAARLMRGMTDALSSLEQQVLFLYLGGCDYETIARRLSVAPKAVDNALCRARKKIKALDRS